MTRSNRDFFRIIRNNLIYALVLGGIAFVAAFFFGTPIPWGETLRLFLAIGFLAALFEEMSNLNAKVEQLETANSERSEELSKLMELRKELTDLKQRIPELRAK